ncbi:hypothetical protein KIL84_002732 [Mauremys mutica]|uniref:Uncharacterized protein n=1 Tax=Mauremys mutica TaxID=74926 RepID=A0A9D4AQQ4_9SAUR|nr:hypothetical protein KIL84_002732 [Mauremys mutica]
MALELIPLPLLQHPHRQPAVERSNSVQRQSYVDFLTKRYRDAATVHGKPLSPQRLRELANVFLSITFNRDGVVPGDGWLLIPLVGLPAEPRLQLPPLADRACSSYILTLTAPEMLPVLQH